MIYLIACGQNEKISDSENVFVFFSNLKNFIKKRKGKVLSY